ncbi:transposase [Nonomuraea sp. NPDC049750]|uniref:transposase n=1 Tax=Nonomuraea sp. NPDC049750 TaxID=3154738 RepID=UPI0033F7CC0A
MSCGATKTSPTGTRAMGAPGVSPAQLATVSVLQFLLDLSDRQAAEAVRCRIDFKYALALELDDPGFHHSVIADFRDRLAQGDRADRLLDLALARLKDAGLVRERTTQRTDSTHVLASVRDLTRLELITEAVRAALEELAGIAPHLLARPSAPTGRETLRKRPQRRHRPHLPAGEGRNRQLRPRRPLRPNWRRPSG